MPHKNFLQKVRKNSVTFERCNFLCRLKIVAALELSEELSGQQNNVLECQKKPVPNVKLWTNLGQIKQHQSKGWNANQATHKKSLGLNYVTWKVEVCKAVWIIKNFLSLRINAKRTYKGSKDIVKIIEIYFQRKKNLVKSTTYLVINLVRMSL